jgi:hypothetical protein
MRGDGIVSETLARGVSTGAAPHRFFTGGELVGGRQVDRPNSAESGSFSAYLRRDSGVEAERINSERLAVVKTLAAVAASARAELQRLTARAGRLTRLPAARFVGGLQATAGLALR